MRKTMQLQQQPAGLSLAAATIFTKPFTKWEIYKGVVQEFLSSRWIDEIRVYGKATPGYFFFVHCVSNMAVLEGNAAAARQSRHASFNGSSSSSSRANVA